MRQVSGIAISLPLLSSIMTHKLEEINKKADDMIFRIRNMNDQLDICVIRVGQLEERIDQMKNSMKVMWTKRNEQSS